MSFIKRLHSSYISSFYYSFLEKILFYLSFYGFLLLIVFIHYVNERFFLGLKLLLQKIIGWFLFYWQGGRRSLLLWFSPRRISPISRLFFQLKTTESLINKTIDRYLISQHWLVYSLQILVFFSLNIFAHRWQMWFKSSRKLAILDCLSFKKL